MTDKGFMRRGLLGGSRSQTELGIYVLASPTEVGGPVGKGSLTGEMLDCTRQRGQVSFARNQQR